jgi:hypothetical protein
MTSGTITPDCTRVQAGRDGFPQLLRAEWTKFRTVRGWVIGMLAAALVVVGLGLLPGMHGSCGQHGAASACALPVGPGGQEVTDSLYFVHRPLAGNGSITVRVTSLTGLLPPQPAGGNGSAGQDPHEGLRPGLVPWAKAGLIIKASTKQGSAYAAVMVTGSHGVRMQYNYTHDIAGPPGAVSAASPRWLRLTRSGDTITGAESADGTHWTTLGTAHLAGLGSTVQAGLLATSPQYTQVIRSFVLTGDAGGPSQATAAFDHLDRQGTWPSQAWTGEDIGGSANATSLQRGGFDQAGGGFTVTGSGDIAPAVAGAAGLGTTITQTLVGTFAGLIVVVVVGAMFITAEYRRGLIRTTLAASPRRGRILAAKAIVIGGVTYLTGLIAAAVVVTAGQRILRGNGVLRPRGDDRHPVARGGRHRGAACRGRGPGPGDRRPAAAQRRRGHHRHPGDRAALPPRDLSPARRRRAMAAADHPRRRLRHPAEHPAIPPGQQQLHPGERLLPAGAVGRLRRAVRLGRARPGPGRRPAAPEGRVSQAPPRWRADLGDPHGPASP